MEGRGVVQTFVPFADFAASAAHLDRARLGKQRVEVLQIVRALAGETRGWVNHPATRMWRGYERALIRYGLAVCREWRRRGYKDTCAGKIAVYRTQFPRGPLPPWWHGPIHASHRSALLAKDPEFYGRYGWRDPVGGAYVWPR